MDDLDHLHHRLWQDWRYRFWYVALWPYYRFVRYRVKLTAWVRRGFK